jgi:hypothetical protein
MFGNVTLLSAEICDRTSSANGIVVQRGQQILDLIVTQVAVAIPSVECSWLGVHPSLMSRQLRAKVRLSVPPCTTYRVCDDTRALSPTFRLLHLTLFCNLIMRSAVVVSVLTVALAQSKADPFENFCRRHWHQTCLIDDILYLDGGVAYYSAFISSESVAEPSWHSLCH